jgi:uncharacterized protein (DUF1330 family)
MTRIRTLWLSLLVAVVAAGYATAAPNKPKSVIQVITIQWKADATPEQIQKAIRAAENINYPGIKNVWTKPIKMQLPEGYKHIIVMEFESEEALKKYADSPAQKAMARRLYAHPGREQHARHYQLSARDGRIGEDRGGHGGGSLWR